MDTEAKTCLPIFCRHREIFLAHISTSELTSRVESISIPIGPVEVAKQHQRSIQRSFKIWLFINFAVISLSIRENLVFHILGLAHKKHSTL